MKPLTAEWIAKAEGDFALMEREGRVRKNPSYDGVCFHAQQCAEKYLKALLCAAGGDAGRTHDLVTLMEHVLPFEPLWEALRQDLAFLSDFAVAYRYPGQTSTKEQARDAFARCCCFGQVARHAPQTPS